MQWKITKIIVNIIIDIYFLYNNMFRDKQKLLVSIIFRRSVMIIIVHLLLFMNGENGLSF